MAALVVDAGTSCGQLRLEIRSVAGIGTALVVPRFRLAMDLGGSFSSLCGADSVLITHGHPDHWWGVHWWHSQRLLFGRDPGALLVPAPIASRFRSFVSVGARLAATPPPGVKPVEPGAGLKVAPGVELEFFLTQHTESSVGARLVVAKRRLAQRFRGLSEERLRELAASGVQLSEEVRVPLLSYLGDTDGRSVGRLLEEWSSEVMVVECTFFREKDLERSRRYRHVHLRDLEEVWGKLNSRLLLLCHTSARYSLGEVEKMVEDALERSPARPRVMVVGRRSRPR